MDKQREAFVKEIDRLRNAIDKTKSEHLQKDYSKAISRMERELADYDRFKSGNLNGRVTNGKRKVNASRAS